MKLLLIDIDTMRPDHMGCYGYGRNTTPNMDKIASEGVVFHNYYCSDAPCLPSRAALVSGMFGIRNGVVGHGGTCADRQPFGKDRGFTNPADTNNLHYIFRKAGCYTASISTFAERHSSHWFQAGFHETHNVGKGGAESGEEVLPVAIDWINRNAKRENWYLHLNLWDPHTPYRAPAQFGNPFEKDPFGEWITKQVFEEHTRHVGPHSAREINMFDDAEDPNYPRQPGKLSEYGDLRRLFDGYDCGIRYADEIVGRIFDALRVQNVFDETAVIITSDHGENMGELGIYAEHATADRATCRIPMIFKWPGGVKGHRDDRLHYHLDLLPTLAELLHAAPVKTWDGESYAKTVTEGQDAGRDSLVISQLAHVCQRSAVFDGWLYMRTYHDGYHLFDREMLFSIEDDPYEQIDVKDKFPEICAKGAKIILDWQDRMLERSDSFDPLWTVLREGGPYHARGRLPEYLERLEKTQRGGGAARLRKRYAGRPDLQAD